MSTLAPITSTSLEAACGASGAAVASNLNASGFVGQYLYEYGANVASWISQGIAATVFTADSTVAGGTFTVTAGHKLVTGMALQVSTSSALPTGLSAATTYWAIVLTSTTFQLATTRANALAGTSLTISDDGTGTQTAQAVATAGAGSMYVPAGVVVVLDGANGAQVSTIDDGSAGKASVTYVSAVRQ